ncbi:MAG TPA: hypothetical protein VFA89_18835 [Terriglobales bacterium]|nr:hypothetical protein [Terriglobales bacterium]
MLRSACVWLLIAVISGSPCLAQMTLTAEQAAKYAERERQERLGFIQGYKEKLARAQAAGNYRAAAAFATALANEYERPGHYDKKPLDEAEARKWYAYAASQGNDGGSAHAAYYLGLMYWDGRGGPQDKERAKYIWMWAAENGDRNAIVELEQRGYDLRKERELAFGKAQSLPARQPAPDASTQQQKAEEGMAIVFGLSFAAALAKNYTCQQERQQQLMAGSAVSSDCR